jgi:osmoprotectant transport system substrate-binding protein
MKSIHRLLILIGLVLFTAFTAVACDGSSRSQDTAAAIKVGSKDFTEAFILGEMYALMLEANGLTVERKLNLGGTPIAQAGLISGEIDLYPEYDTVAQEYQDQFELVWLQAAPMNNTQALAMTQEKASQYNIRTISDLVAQGEQLTVVSTPEFEEREDGLPGLKRVYGDFEFKRLIPVDAGLRYEALIRGEADVVEAFGTDGQISAYNLVVLEDDKGLFPPYQVAPVVRQAVLEANPGIRDALDALAPKLTDETMRRLNYEVDGKQREPADVAAEFLQQEELIQ